MSRILLAWELGAGSGHLAALRPVVAVLLARGHQVTLAAQNLRTAARVFEGMDFPVLPAPRTHEIYGGLEDPPLNFSEILMRYGYIDAPMLAALVRAWRTLIELTAAEVLIVDHAPTALLAARGMPGLRRMTFGNPFAVPPPVSPTPNMRSWLDVPEKRLRSSDALVLETINQSLPPSAARLSHVHELFDDSTCIFVGVPELDPYGPRAKELYMGLHVGISGMAQPQWPDGAGRRVFAYLRADHPAIEVVLKALASCDARCLVHIVGDTAGLAERHASSRVVFSEKPVDIQSAVRHCDLVLCHSGIGAVNATLRGGKPMLLLPAQLEQFLLARNVAATGSAIVLAPEDVAQEIRGVLTRLLNEPVFGESAEAFARRYGALPADQLVLNVVDRIEQCAMEAMS